MLHARDGARVAERFKQLEEITEPDSRNLSFVLIGADGAGSCVSSPTSSISCSGMILPESLRAHERRACTTLRQDGATSGESVSQSMMQSRQRIGLLPRRTAV